MTPFLQIALILSILIAAAKTGGFISYRFGQPSVLGELLVGLLLGPTLVNILHFPYFSAEHLPETIHILAELGVLFLMFLAGLELDFKDLVKTRKVAALAGINGVIIPLGLGCAAALIFSIPLVESIFIGVILAATSVSISAQTLIELNMLRSRVGTGLLAAAVFDDILVVLGLSVFTALAFGSSTDGLRSVLIVFIRMGFYLALALGFGRLLLPRASRRVHSLPISQGITAFTIIVILLFGWAAEELGGMAAITGAFLAGLSFGRSPVKERIEHNISTIAYGFFVPVFFINVGLIANLRDLGGASFWLFMLLTAAAVVGKIFGAGAGAYWGGLSRRESLQFGIGMMSRGEVGLIVASVGVSQNIIDSTIFSAIVGVVIITTLLTPPMLRWSFRTDESIRRSEELNSNSDKTHTTETKSSMGDSR